MSQNKTVIQGLEPADSASYNNAGSNFYSRGGYRPAAHGTVVSGMEDAQRSAVSGASSSSQTAQPQRSTVSSRPVVGFLYSVSRTMAGEFWPLHVGQNTIGQRPDSDIVLPEGTVSGEHAVLVVRKMKNPEKVIASINDARSTNGTMLNGVSLGFSPEECKTGDIITIGDNYELLLILVDAAAHGLKVSQDFIPVEVDDAENITPPPIPDGYTRPGEGFQPFEGGFNPYSGGTMGFDGSTSGSKGGTIGM